MFFSSLLGYTAATFKISDDGGHCYTEANLDAPLAVRVFNADFTRDNLRWDEGIEPVFILGEQNIQLEEELKERRRLLDEKSNSLQSIREQVTRKEEALEDGLSDKAREIKNSLSIPSYFKNHFLRQIEVVENVNACLLSETDMGKAIMDYRNTDKKPKIIVITIPDIDLASLHGDVEQLMKRTVAGRTIQRLVDDEKLQKWVREGRNLHEGKALCQFCEQPLPEGYIARLDQCFSAEFESLLIEIDECIGRLEVKKLDIALPEKAAFYDILRVRYENSTAKLVLAEKAHNGMLDRLVTALEQKKLHAFTSQKTPLLEGCGADVSESLLAINDLICEHNEISEGFAARKEGAKSLLLMHYAADFMKSKNYFWEVSSIERLKKELKQAVIDRDCLEREVKAIEEQLSDSVKGAGAINACLLTYFGKDDIKVEVASDNRFRLTRAGQQADNLSEGEKTAIAFAYFMTRLQDRSTDLARTIVFVDDPISSLDANHLYFVYSMIKNTLGEAHQLFIATHNFEFFNLAKDWRSRDNRTSKNSSIYLVERNKRNGESIQSNILPIPETLKKFKSEYHYLFSLVYGFHQGPSANYGVLYNLPNLVRRLLEAFLGFKKPIGRGLEVTLPWLIDNPIERDAVLKFIHEYSHNRALHRSLIFPDLSECEKAVAIVLKSMKDKDPVHFADLCEMIDKTDPEPE